MQHLMAVVFDCTKEAFRNSPDYITALIGVGGTLLGTVLGWLLSRLSTKGKLVFYIQDWQDRFTRPDYMGGQAPSENVESTESYNYSLKIGVYNSSAEPRVMRDFRILFDKAESGIYESIPYEKSNDTAHRACPIDSINVEPKRIIELTLCGGMHKGSGTLQNIWNTKKVFLQYSGSKSRKHRVLLKNEDYSKYFENHPKEE